MKESLIITGCFVAGVLLGRFFEVPELFTEGEVALYVLYVLMFLVGVSIGRDREILKALRQQNLKIVLVPLATISGTFLGTALISGVMQGRSLTDCLAVGAGFGYYSLSSVFITQYKGAELGTIALVSNVLRELTALLAAPWQAGANSCGRGDFYGYDTSGHYPLFGQGVCGGGYGTRNDG